MIENTSAEDGDPADAMVFTECITYPGVRMSCRLIGGLYVRQIKDGDSIRNDRFLMVPVDSIMYGNIDEIKDFSKHHNKELQDFFVNYMMAEDKKLVGMRFMNASRAAKALLKLMK